MTNPIVIDISHWQKEPDFKRVKAGGTVGVIMKATQGSTYVDPTFASRATKARAAGLQVSSYHFLEHGNIAQQMDHYLKIVEPGPNERLCIDFEPSKVNPTLQDLLDAVDYLWDKGVRNITVYSGHLIKEVLKGGTSPELAQRTSLWIAHYTTAKSPVWPTQVWPAWSLWQYTDAGLCDGIDGKIDANRWNGDPARLPGWFDSDLIDGDAEEPAAPTAPVQIQISTPPGVTVQLFVNGKEWDAD